MSMKIALDIENGGFAGLFAFSACWLEMISSSPVEIKDAPFPNVRHVHPLRGTTLAGRRWPVQAVAAPGGCTSI
jgi:hypothetical protein